MADDVSAAEELSKLLASGCATGGAGVTRALFFIRVVRTGGGKQHSVKVFFSHSV